MLTYLILHYNRPYFLDLILQTIRKYSNHFPKDSRILIADDHSNLLTKEYLYNLEFAYAPLNNGKSFILQNSTYSHTSQSCCQTIKQAINQLKEDPNEYVLWSEDDFIYCPNEIILPPEEAKGEDLLNNLNVDYKEKAGEKVINQAIKCLALDKAKIVQISRPVKANVHYIETCNYYKYLDHTKMSKYYYTNWPFITKKEYLIELGKDMPEYGSIERYEQFAGDWWNKKFGSSENFILVPNKPRFIHIGYSFSQQPEGNKNPRRQNAFQDLQRILRTDKDWEEINSILIEKFKNREFRFDLNKIEEKGLGVAMREELRNVQL